MKVFAVIFIALAFMGCSTLNQVYPVPAEPVCAKPENSTVVLCKVFAYAGLQAEQVNDIFLDASLLSVWTKAIKAEQLRKAVTEVRAKVVEKKILTWEGLIAYTSGDPALSLFLSRRAAALKTVPVYGQIQLDQKSIDMIAYHCDRQMEQLAFFK